MTCVMFAFLLLGQWSPKSSPHKIRVLSLKCRFGGSRSEVGGSVFLTSSFRTLMLLAARTAL